MVVQVKLLDGSLDEFRPPVSRDTLDASEVLNVFLNGHVLENGIGLRAVTDKFLDLVEILADVKRANMDRSFSRLNLTGQTLESGRLSSAVHTEKSEALSCLEAKGDVLDGDERLDRLAAATCDLVNLA